MIDWQSGKKRLLRDGIAVEVWQEPKAHYFIFPPRVWVYAFIGTQPEREKETQQPLYRFPIDAPDEKELVWNKSRMSWSSMQLSRDGSLLGGLFPWPNAGVLNTDSGKWQGVGRGCWTSLSPDNSKLMWIFDDLHRNLWVHDLQQGGKWQVNINGAPGIDGYEVYHPRWSNHPRFFVITGPYVEGKGRNRIRAGGNKVEVYIGRLDSQAKKVEAWMQATHNDRPDFFPDLWVEGGEKVVLADALPRPAGVAQ